MTITVTHLPNSDPAQAVVYEVGGRANRYGYFQPAPGDAFTFEVPGEFRVDISADYVAADGTISADGRLLGQPSGRDRPCGGLSR